MIPSRSLGRAAVLLLLVGTGALAQQTTPDASGRKPAIALELNKLEAAPNGCRAYFVVDNRSAEAVKELRLDTFIFDTAGTISRRLGLTFPDLRPERTKVVPFDLAGASCPEIGRVLINDVLACLGPGGAPAQGCGDLLSVSSRAAAKFEY